MKAPKVRLSRTQKLLLALLCLFCILAQILGIYLYCKDKEHRQSAAARQFGEMVSRHISIEIAQSTSVPVFIKDLYLEYGEGFLDDFDGICRRVEEANKNIRGIYFAPKGVISWSYPPNENIKGFDIFEQEAAKGNLEKTIKSGVLSITGPVNLDVGNNGKGLVIKYPISIDGEFYAFSLALIDWNKFSERIFDLYSVENSGYKIAIQNKNSESSVVDENGYIGSNCEGIVSSRIRARLPMLNDEWYLYIEPITGWVGKKTVILTFLISILLILGIIVPVYYRQRRNAYNIYSAQHDELTGILSRGAFLKKLTGLLSGSDADEFVVVAADIENFKVTNSIYSTAVGDKILKYLAQRYEEISYNGLCSRFGGDQFMMVMKINLKNNIYDFMENVANDIAKNAPIENLVVKYGFYGHVEKSIPSNLICDRALLAAKSILHNYEKTVANYEGPLSRENIKAQLLESSFITAIKNEDFKVWFQPKFDAVTEKIVGAEALVRWIKDDGTVVSPIDFIHVFEEDGLIYKLDLYVFERVCNSIKHWQENGYAVLPISVNISRTTLQHKNVIKEYKEILDQVGISSDFVPLEITESASTMNQDIKQLADDLKAAGFQIHMDDFGTGLSSLESLNFLPFDVIKLDKSLIDFIGTPVGEELLRHTIELAQFMDMKIIAEGVENKEQLEFLRKLKCNHIQGYYFSAPVSYYKFLDFMKNHNI